MAFRWGFADNWCNFSVDKRLPNFIVQCRQARPPLHHLGLPEEVFKFVRVLRPFRCLDDNNAVNRQISYKWVGWDGMVSG